MLVVQCTQLKGDISVTLFAIVRQRHSDGRREDIHVRLDGTERFKEYTCMVTSRRRSNAYSESTKCDKWCPAWFAFFNPFLQGSMFN